MKRTFAILVAMSFSGPALAGSDDDFLHPLRQFNSGPSSSGAYGSFHDTYQSPQNDGAYRQYDQERRNRQQYREED
jgi:hypothetical protein